ncbi:MAG: zinc metalloprotease HtpX [Acidobacteriaceae bacterium]|nr:zinc metalloprotease HtpX [Acidobacteriaceae bacterium]MBV9763485.1 zinc metalloprotease HtpX [Acidobacteriaceae bacterium]
MNTVKTVLLLGVLSGLLLFLGEAFGGRNGLYIGLVLAVVMNFFSYFLSDKIALATYSAQPVTPEQNPGVYARVAPIVAGLAQRMGIAMPKLWLIPDNSPNAFATGRNPQHASVAFTAGILEAMSDAEIEGVVAHELGHVLHRDILISSVAATIASAITFLARMGFFFGGSSRDDDNEGGAIGGFLMLILAPFAALLIQMAISRSREYDADAASAKYTGKPYELISALQKLDDYSKRMPLEATPSTAHLFIIKPFTGESLMRLFSTHPSTADRIARLQAIRS